MKCLEKTMILSNMMMRKDLSKKRTTRKYNTSLKSKRAKIKLKSKRISKTQEKNSGITDKQEAYLYDNIFIQILFIILITYKYVKYVPLIIIFYISKTLPTE